MLAQMLPVTCIISRRHQWHGYLLVGISGEMLVEFCRIPQFLEFKNAEH
jgi:hypothetical protein